ncbi:cardiolipin synthase [Bacillus pseudomycoides]|uniref:Cardiolipin synthase n=1 Tax=Bacillus pseudomycoides TaxID=64104 RepID=A0AA91ZRI6_9BACI|nr:MULTISPECIES: cardiolipin synthase [Bacillus]PEB54294.1 cardiolipin synthase [Bacillus sp. AFS098217]PED80457.1 cardiolipin synthase [Bacillus pseudomycoides]PEU11192.1 cardiolipin synthase [Bacillus sp. AFS014408]PEU13067.1 cardiolipin synthase [Bacillus sp. AFS019443]PFW61958.1 cardiolipin synthase [Bacillus sp. AFS075034]
MKHFIGFMICLIGVFIWMNIDVEMGKKMAGGYEISKIRYGNFKLFVDGEDLYQKLFDDINRAEKYVYIHFYIVGKDEVSHKFLQLLERKASSGVDVKLSVDRIGGYKVKKKVIEHLKGKGVKFTFSKKPKFKNLFYSLQQRNHRRIVAIDGKVSYIGGFNIGKEYLGQDPTFGEWRDYQMRIEGDGAIDMERQFAEDWQADTGEKLPLYEGPAIEGEAKYQYVFSNGKGLWQEYSVLLKKAKKSLIIATPYFVPSKEMMNGLQEALGRGVRVKILVPFKSDAILLKQAAYPHLKNMLDAGAEIYQYRNGFFHGKVTIIDDTSVDVGTANFDNRSFYINTESNCFIYDKAVVAQVWGRLQEDFYKSKRFSDRDFEEINSWDWFLARIANVLAPYL